MAITIALGSNPMWYSADLVGKPLGSGTYEFFSSLNPDNQKPVFQDSAGMIPWTNPIEIPLNGQLNQPIYFETDSTIPGDNYYIVARDSSGNVVWTMDGYFPSGGGGSGPTPVLNNFKNYIKNNGFWRNVGTAGPVAPSPGLPATLTLAPSVHAGFALAPTGYAAQNFQSDIYLSKNTTDATDQINFIKFPLGSVPFNPLDVTPVYYLNYNCTAAGTENIKDIIFPISLDVKTFEQQAISFSLWTQNLVGVNTLTISFLQYFGSNGSSPIYTPMGTISVGASWAKSVINFPLPSVGGGTRGTTGDDFIAIVVRLPTMSISSFNVAKPSFYLGTVNPATDYDTFDEADSIGNTPRTGDIKVSLDNFHDYGWVPANDGTIGMATPVNSNATTRANVDTYPLYQKIYNATTNALAPLYTPAGTPVARGASALADFTAGNALSLTKMLGRVMAGTATPPVARTYTVTAANILTLAPNANGFLTGMPIVLSGNTVGQLINGLTYYIIRLAGNTISLATSAENAIALVPIPITFPNAGTGTITLPAHALGTFLGNEEISTNQMPSHTHPIVSPSQRFVFDDNTPPNAGGGGGNLGVHTPTIGPTGGVATVNPPNVPTYIGGNQPPTSYYNVFFKL